MDRPEFYIALFSGISLLIYIGVTIAGAVIFIVRKIDKVRDEILLDVTIKHRENDQRYNALNTLVIRHDTMLNAEFNAVGRHVR